MKCLLDTCVFLWILDNNRSKLKKFINIIEEPNNELLLSVVSYWEILVKQSLGKLEIENNWISLLEKTGITWLSLEPSHVRVLEQLPMIHNDPFDRLLIAQARAENVQLLTLDEKILKY